ncbi:MAG: hypothetical protein ACT4OS_10185, partial [Acidimicrobiales bacterium]
PMPAGTGVAHDPWHLSLLGISAGLSACPAPPAAVAAVLEAFVETLDLPRPSPRIGVGYAITGLPAHLATNGAVSASFTRPTPLGELVVKAVGTYSVDWGDGTITGPHWREGRPWPDGEILHTYSHVGTYDVIVSQQWRAEWSIFGTDYQGVIDDLTTATVVEDLVVDQVQTILVNE